MNSCDYRIFWEETVKQLKEEIGEQEISMWFSRIVYERASDTTIVLSVPSGFYRDNVRQRYELLIEKKLLELLGSRISIEFEIKAPQVTDTQPVSPKSTHTSAAFSATAPHVAQKTAVPEEKKKHPLLNERYTFDKFVIEQVYLRQQLI